MSPYDTKGRSTVTQVSTIVHVQTLNIPIEIETKGGVPERDIDYLSKQLERVLRPIAESITHVRALMTIHHERAPGVQARVRVTLHTKGDPICSEVVAASIRDGILAVETRLHHELEHRTEQSDRDREGNSPIPGEWRHSSLPSARRHGFHRPPNDRKIITRTSPTTPLSTLDERRWDQFVLDYGFFLSVDADTGRDMLLAPGKDTDSDVLFDIDEAPTMSIENARTWLAQTIQDFHFFRDAESGRGAVIYRRYDGHDGLLIPQNLDPRVS